MEEPKHWRAVESEMKGLLQAPPMGVLKAEVALNEGNKKEAKVPQYLPGLMKMGFHSNYKAKMMPLNSKRKV